MRYLNIFFLIKKKETSMKIGEIITLQRESTPSTGYRWYVSYLKNFALLGEELEYDSADGGAFGKSGTQVFTLQAIQDGRAEVQFVKYRTFEPDKRLYDDVLLYDVEPEAEQTGNEVHALLGLNPGGWKPFAEPNEAALTAFKEAVGTLAGVDYQPLLAASQIVNGVNYAFIANAKIVYPDARSYAVLVRVYKKPDEQARVIEIKRIGRPTGTGAYGKFKEISGESKDALTEAFKHFVGSSFIPLKVVTQTVAGRNYCFAGNIKAVTPGAVEAPALVTVYSPPKGEAKITEIQKVYEV
jgi:predicted secreted protein